MAWVFSFDYLTVRLKNYFHLASPFLTPASLKMGGIGWLRFPKNPEGCPMPTACKSFDHDTAR